MCLGIVFTGQGSQRIGMGEDFYNSYNIAKELFDVASESLQIDIPKLCFTENTDIHLTKYTQPCLLTLEIAIFKVLATEYHLKADYFAGHSLGEYSALVASDVLSFVDALKIVQKRGSLMQDISTKGDFLMGAIIHENLENLEYKKILMEHDIEIANFNSLNQVVVSGLKNNIQQLKTALEEKIPDINFVIINVSSPFHSHYMNPIKLEFQDYLNTFEEKINFKNSSRVLSNYTGKLHDPDSLLLHLVKQSVSSVKWLDNMNVMIKLANTIYEIGPNKVLSKFFNTLNKEVKSIINIRSMNKIFS